VSVSLELLTQRPPPTVPALLPCTRTLLACVVVSICAPEFNRIAHNFKFKGGRRTAGMPCCIQAHQLPLTSTCGDCRIIVEVARIHIKTSILACARTTERQPAAGARLVIAESHAREARGDVQPGDVQTPSSLARLEDDTNTPVDFTLSPA
jgi:hypothetical protein